jgi:hypothetical protein
VTLNYITSLVPKMQVIKLPKPLDGLSIPVMSVNLWAIIVPSSLYFRIHGIPSRGFREGVIAQEYNELWLVMSVISADTCDCIYQWSAPW